MIASNKKPTEDVSSSNCEADVWYYRILSCDTQCYNSETYYQYIETMKDWCGFKPRSWAIKYGIILVSNFEGLAKYLEDEGGLETVIPRRTLAGL